MAANAESLPNVKLNRMRSVRLTAVGIIVAFMLLRTVPDVYRLFVPLGTFDYATDDNGVVIKTPDATPKGTDKLQLGDRVRLDRIQPFDRKPGLARASGTRSKTSTAGSRSNCRQRTSTAPQGGARDTGEPGDHAVAHRPLRCGGRIRCAVADRKPDARNVRIFRLRAGRHRADVVYGLDVRRFPWREIFR